MKQPPSLSSVRSLSVTKHLLSFLPRTLSSNTCQVHFIVINCCWRCYVEVVVVKCGCVSVCQFCCSLKVRYFFWPSSWFLSPPCKLVICVAVSLSCPHKPRSQTTKHGDEKRVVPERKRCETKQQLSVSDQHTYSRTAEANKSMKSCWCKL